MRQTVIVAATTALVTAIVAIWGTTIIIAHTERHPEAAPASKGGLAKINAREGTASREEPFVEGLDGTVAFPDGLLTATDRKGRPLPTGDGLAPCPHRSSDRDCASSTAYHHNHRAPRLRFDLAADGWPPPRWSPRSGKVP